MRLIDADALHKAYMELRNFKQDTQSGDWISLRAVPLTTVVRMLNEAPTIDAVSVVRCKECRWIRYCETEDLDMYLDCDKPDGGGIPRNEDWFCADGEREGE